jgi:uncharacterized membrane protein
MKRDTKIAFAVLSMIPVSILTASTLCAWAVANGASERWRLLFRFLCHGMPERCLEIFGVPMPICARCFGIYAGLFLGFACFRAALKVSERVMRGVAIGAVVPLAIDGLTQLARLRESTNDLRVATGLAAGFAFGMWVLAAIERSVDATVTAS